MDLFDPPCTLQYKAIEQCRKNLVDCIAQSPDKVALQLKPLDKMLPKQSDNYGKARSIVDLMQGLVQQKPQLFGTVLKALEAAGPWTKTVVDELKQTLSSLQNSGNSGPKIQPVDHNPWPSSRGGFEQYIEQHPNLWPKLRGDPRQRKERIDLTPWSSSQAQASQYPLMTPGSLAITGTLSSGARASPQSQSAVDVLTQNVPGTDMMHRQGGFEQYIEQLSNPWPSARAQASQHPLMTPGSLSSGARASAQSQSAVDVPTRNVPRTNLMHRQVGRKRTTDVDPPMTAKHPKLATEIKTDQTTASGSRSSQLEELCSRFNLSDDDIKKEVSDDHILEIYLQLEKWKQVAAHLSLTRADVEAIESSARPNEELMRLYMLQEWKKKKRLDGTASYQKLLEALISCSCSESAVQVCKMFSAHKSSS